MAESTYLQRLIARMGMPSVGAVATNAPSLALPHAPAPPVYDPFAEAEAFAEGQTPPAIDARMPAEPSFHPPPTSVIQEEAPTPLLEKETVREVFYLPPERMDVEPRSEMEESTRSMALLPPQPTDDLGELVPSLSQEPETVERVVYTTIEASFPESPPTHTVFDREEVGDLPLPSEPEMVERVIHEILTQPQAEILEITMEPPPTLDTPDATPILETPAPQITIGEIVVEVVTQAEKSTRAPSLPQPRGVRPPEAQAPRPGVRSKRGFGLGQI